MIQQTLLRWCTPHGNPTHLQPNKGTQFIIDLKKHVEVSQTMHFFFFPNYPQTEDRVERKNKTRLTLFYVNCITRIVKLDLYRPDSLEHT